MHKLGKVSFNQEAWQRNSFQKFRYVYAVFLRQNYPNKSPSFNLIQIQKSLTRIALTLSKSFRVTLKQKPLEEKDGMGGGGVLVLFTYILLCSAAFSGEIIELEALSSGAFWDVHLGGWIW